MNELDNKRNAEENGEEEVRSEAGIVAIDGGLDWALLADGQAKLICRHGYEERVLCGGLLDDSGNSGCKAATWTVEVDGASI